MKYIVLGKSQNASQNFMDSIISDMIQTDVVYGKKSKNEYSVMLENGNTFQTVSGSSNLRGRRADVILFQEDLNISDYFANTSHSEWICWSDYQESGFNKNKYVVELI